ncbi:MAG: GntR family transcriptional regulator, partial [Atribacterota bacterium]
MVDLAVDSGIPLYQQVKNILKGQILDGRLKNGEKIPPESELCSTYAVSRITIRQAMSSLVQEGFLYRKQGKGTFVTVPKLGRRLPRLYSFSEDMRDLGLEPGSQIIESELIDGDDDISTLLSLPPTARKVNKMIRL